MIKVGIYGPEQIDSPKRKQLLRLLLRHPDVDLRGSNKCLIQLYAEGNKLHVRASIDALTRGVTGNAVHIMNLLFGLYERTGLSI